MLDLLVAVVAVVAVIALYCTVGRRRQASGLARAEADPASVDRLYLRQAADVDVYWLHVRFKDGRKYCIAAPWDVEATLARLGRAGLRLAAEDRAAVSAQFGSAPAQRPARG